MSRTLEAHTSLEALLREPALLLARQLQQTADAAPDGQVLARVEALAVAAARERARQAVPAALQTQAEAAEKKGRRADAAPPATRAPGTRDASDAPSGPLPATSACNGFPWPAPAAPLALTPSTSVWAAPASSARRPANSSAWRARPGPLIRRPNPWPRSAARVRATRLSAPSATKRRRRRPTGCTPTRRRGRAR